jgi:hypothetical protein
MYAPLGYGERIVHPLVALVLLASAAAWITTGNGGSFSHVFVTMLSSPLAFFRFTSEPGAEGIVDSLALLIMRTMGLFFIILAIVAARRVVRAE